MTRFGRAAWLLAVFAACAPTNEEQSEELGGSAQSIIYGLDDRREVYDHPDPALRALAQSSVLALIPRTQFARSPAGDIRIITKPLRDVLGLCMEERFLAQPTAAVCSGVLLEDDLVLTAGHCFPTDGCDRYAFVFDYHYRNEDKLESIGWGDIYGCRKIIAQSVSAENSPSRVDYAIVQLDRPAAGRRPAEIRATPLSAGEQLATIGSASGLPAKIDSGSRVLDARATVNDYFTLDSDTFEGSSGSGVFDGAAKLVGVFVRGGIDYSRRMDSDCMVPNIVQLAPDAGTPSGVGEEATYVGRALEGLCAQGWPSARLCGREPLCGDGFCTSSESRTTCPADCGCTRGECEDQSTPPAAAGAAVPKAKQPKEDDGCALGGRSPSLGSMWLVFAALWAARRRAARG